MRALDKCVYHPISTEDCLLLQVDNNMIVVDHLLEEGK